MNANSAKSASKILTIGVAVILTATLLSQSLAIISMVLAGSPKYNNSVWLDVLYIFRTLFDSVIFAAGAALIVTFVRLGDRKNRLLAYLLSLAVLFLDYGVSFTIDYAYGLVDGYELYTLLYLFLNFAVRAIMYALIILFASASFDRFGKGDTPIPFVSFAHPTSRIINIVFLLRIVPYLVFEVYSNITGIIEYGFDMSGSEILAIISAYVEILIDGALIYCVVYLLTVLYSNIAEHTKE